MTKIPFLLAAAALPGLLFAQAPTPNQAAEQARRELERSRQEARDNLERGRRGEIEPAEVRRERSGKTPSGASSVPPEAIARWERMEPQQLAADPDFVRALQNDDPAALAHWEGVLNEMNGDLRRDAASRAWLGGPVFIPGQESIEFAVRDGGKPARKAPARKKDAKEAAKPEEQRPHPIHERASLERALKEARDRYEDALRERDDRPGNHELITRAEHEQTRVRLAEERYQNFLRENAPDELRARQQERNALEARALNPRQLTRDQLPPRRDPAERPKAPELQDYEGRQGTNPDHILRGPDGEERIVPGLDRGTPYQRPSTPELNAYEGRQGTNPDHILRGGPEGHRPQVMRDTVRRPPAERPRLDLKDYEAPDTGSSGGSGG